MDTYSAMRHFADSWGLLAMTGFYLGAILWVFRPGARRSHDEAATVVFRHEDSPAGKFSDQMPGKDA